MPEQEGLYYSGNENSFRSTSQIIEENKNRIYPDKKERDLDFERITQYLEEGQRIVTYSLATK